jgi:ubiquinone/menaquinone biosynthesis C-methylase UbiE
MDELAQYNKARWEALAQANIAYSRPFLDLGQVSARQVVDREGVLGEVAGWKVLCLAGGGGQQSAAFALLGAEVTVLDLSETQLERDRQAAAHYQVQITTLQGDMRDLSRFAAAAFDLVWHAHSLNFVPEARPVFREVARVLRPNGLYRLNCHNPFAHGLEDTAWDGQAYPLKLPYIDGAELIFDNPHWNFEDVDGAPRQVEGPREFRHTLSTLLNGMIEQGFMLLGAWEDDLGDPAAEPGSWEHFKAMAPPYLTFWACYRPDLFKETGAS